MTIIESEQSRDIRLTQIVRGNFVYRFASYRKSEEAKMHLRSEDYIVGDMNPDRLIFVLCDGVGSSFCPNVGSQFLAEIVLNWFRETALPSADAIAQGGGGQWLDMLKGALRDELNKRAALATSILHKRPITSEGELTQLAERTLREDFGTQSNFSGGVIWPKSASLPNGLIIVFWLGNARARIFSSTEELTHLSGWGQDPNQMIEVWSSKDGVVGNIGCYLTDLTKVGTIVLYSDGLETVEEHIHPRLSGAELENLVKVAQTRKDDDVSYLEIFTVADEITNADDDLVPAIRQHLLRSSPAEPVAPSDLTQRLDELQKELEAESEKNSRSFIGLRRTGIVLLIITSIFCAVAGMAAGYRLRARQDIQAESVPMTTATATLLPTGTATPEIITMTPEPADTTAPPLEIVPVFTPTVGLPPIGYP